MRPSFWMIPFLASGCSEIVVPLPPLDIGPPEDAIDKIETLEDKGQRIDISDFLEALVCKNDDDCKHLTENCAVGRCKEGTCITEYLPKGTQCTTGEVPDACLTFECDGNGSCIKAFLPDGTQCVPQDPSASCGIYKCEGGECKFAQACQDLDPCTRDECDHERFICRFVPISGEPCDDDDPCTDGDTCVMGICVGMREPCDDQNPCTTDLCSKENGCVHISADGLPCDDGDPCTANDVCREGKCVSGPQIDCDDGNPCTIDKCDEDTGQCVHEPSNEKEIECDANLCTVDDYCEDGFCHPGSSLTCSVPTMCAADVAPDPNCDCIRSVCLPDLGCIYAVENLCMECSFLEAGCADNNPCTREVCDFDPNSLVGDTVCYYELQENHPETSDSCSLVDKCALGGTCSNGICVPTGYKDCDDNNPCTDDFCDKVTGKCVHSFHMLACDDNDPCTFNDRCIMGECKGEPVDCNDQNPCTRDYCDTATGKCVFEPMAGFCDDGNPCTVGDRCVEGVCIGTRASCDDKDPCTIDYCDPKLQICVNQPILACLNCTKNEDCFDGNDCTIDICDDGKCKFLRQNGGACDDGNVCTGDDRCVNGECVGGALKVCEERPCNVVFCDPNKGCVYVPVGGACDDGNQITVGDRCVNGVCVPGALSDCSLIPEGSACTDGDESTTLDFCLAGKCLGIQETPFRIFKRPTYLRAVSATRLIAGYYMDDNNAPKAFLAEIPTSFSTPRVIAETVTAGRYNAVYGLAGAGDYALIAYAHDPTSRWQIRGEFHIPKWMGDISAIDGAFNLLGSHCSDVYHYVFGGTTIDMEQVALIHCKTYSVPFGYLCLSEVACGSFMTFRIPLQNLIVTTKDVSVLTYSGCSYSACIAEAYVGVTTTGASVSSVILKATPPVSGGDMLETLTRASNYFDKEVEAIKVIMDGSKLVLFGVGKSGLMFEIALEDMSPLTDPTIIHAITNQESYDFTSVAASKEYLFVGGVQKKETETEQWVILFHRLASGLGEFGTYTVVPLATCKASTQDCGRFGLLEVAYDEQNSELLIVGSRPTSDGYEGVLYRLDMKKVTGSSQ